MAFLKVPNVAIKGISACVPPKVEENRDIPFYTLEEVDKVIESTGVERKHIVSDGITGSDLCLKAAEILLKEIGWERDTIDAIAYVTQTPDYLSPPTVFVLHDKLELSSDCLAIDLNHGCPGWVIGLASLSSLMSHGSIKRALLLDGDNITSSQYPLDRESRPLFGDCGTATALEFDETVSPLLFHSGTNSKDGVSLIRRKGAYRQPHTLETYKREIGMLSGDLPVEETDDTMDGMSVFSFGITMPPKSMKQLCAEFNLDIDNIDKLLIHQANKFMINKIAKKMKMDLSKVPSCLRDYGNTTSASIPLALVAQCSKEYSSQKIRSLACGFGTGLAWASVYFETENMVCPDVIIY